MLAIHDYSQARNTLSSLRDNLQKICVSFNELEEAQNMLDMAEQGISAKNVANVFDNQILPAMVDFDKTTEAFLLELDNFIKDTEGSLESETEAAKEQIINKYANM